MEMRENGAADLPFSGSSVQRTAPGGGKPLRIGHVELDSPFILAPMAGVTDQPFRILCRENGASLVSMEMVSANAVKYGNKKTLAFVNISPAEHPVSMQLFGPDPETIAYAAEALADKPFDILDINMGCPMPKIVNNNEGSALMRDLPRAAAIVRAAVRATDRPVTVKIRSGFSENEINAVEAAKYLEDAGASAIAVHGRTREQYYSGEADWDIIRAVAEAVSIPVIGNGDVTGPERAEQMLSETGAAGVMIGRACRGNPWLFADCLHFHETGNHLPRPDMRTLADTMLRHAKMQLLEKGDQLGILEMRKHVSWYVTGRPNAASLRARINSVTSFSELSEVIEDWVRSASE